MKLVESMIAGLNEWGGWGHQNSQLEFASMALEAYVAGEDVRPLKPYWDVLVKETRVRMGQFSRSPVDSSANSHDNWIGLAAGSWLLDDGRTAQEILDHGLILGFIWPTSFWPVDGEWFVRPHDMAIMKIAARREVSAFEEWCLSLNLHYSTAWNVKRVRLLLMHAAHKREMIPAGCEARLGDKYKGRYGDDPWYQAAWEMNGGKYDAF